jgi:CubicO group peptidase (beta-lactamase class C family)
MKTITPETVGLSSTRLQRIDRVMQGYVERGQLAGLITVLMRRGEVAHFGMYGQMDNATAKPMREDAIFRIFSMTKPITSLAVMMLYEEGVFHLQYPISMFIPELSNLKVLSNQMDAGSEQIPLARPITIHDLLTHTSGLGYGLDNLLPVDALMLQAKMLRMDETLVEKMARLPQFPLHHQPGLRYTYSIGTDVLGRLVEVVSGMPLNTFFKQRIFEPLGMTDTDFYVPPEKADRLATLYTQDPNGKLVDMRAIDSDNLPHFMTGAWVDKEKQPKFLSGGGGLVSTTADYMRFGRMMRGQGELDGVRLVSRKTIELMTTPHLRPDQFFLTGASFGLGFAIMTSPAQAQMLGSVGAYEAGGAAHTNLWYDPHEDLMGLLMVQYVSYTPSMVGMDFKSLAEAAIED